MSAPLRTIGSICDVKTGKLDANASSENGAYPFFTCSNEPLRIDTYSYEAECVLVAGNGDLNVKYYNGKFDAYQRTYIITLKRGISNVSVKYLYTFFLLYVNTLREKSIGGVIKYIKIGDITEARLPIPSLEEQEQIVAELDLLQGVIDKQKAQLKELDTLAQSIFYDMFGDPVRNDKGWTVKTLGELSSLIVNGNTPKGGSEVYVDNGILFLRSQNVWRNRIDLEDIAHIDLATHSKMKKSSLHHNDILITKTGRINTENSSLGRAALFKGETGSANINGHVYLIRLRDGISHQFVISILTGIAYRDYIRKVCVGGIDKRQINKEHVELFPIIQPPLSLQQAFAEKIEAIEQQKARINTSIAETQKLFDYTMDKYFG